MSDKRCRLTETGRQKLLNVIQDKNDSKLGRDASLDRGTVKKIREGKKAVNYSSLDRLFSSLNLDLERGDYQNLEKPRALHRYNAPESSVQPIIDQKPQKPTKEFMIALYDLDYLHQRTSFKTAIEDVKPAATFLIHGKPHYGQRWLLNQLKSQVPYHTNAWQKSIYIKPHRKDIEVIWQDLAQELKTSASPKDVAKELYQHWLKSTVILAIHDVDLIAGSPLKQFMDEFWQPLVADVKKAGQLQSSYRMLLFLVDNINSKSKLEKSLSFLENIDINEPHIPFVLKELEPFGKNLIEAWVGVQEQSFLSLWKTTASIKEVMCEIVERDSQPISVFTDICQCFDFEWYEIERGLAL
ncbi:MAG: hypothetical protein C6Y22_10440 [Hapalosiphonaceae cyanobacterium JJU2]|nr:MAG: hypothetical protein C6Y22_10440 [Hapalosiphonaceae cyanobacterium JJU2]